MIRHKRSLVIDLKSPSSRSVFLSLVRTADVLIDPYRPGVMARLGLSPSSLLALNPRLIYAHMHGFRPHSSIYADRAGHDINYLAVSGIMSVIGRKGTLPSPPANVLGDMAGGGLVCVTGILLALHERTVSGRGQVVTANMVDGSAYLATMMRQQRRTENLRRPRGENLLDGAAPFYDVYECKHGGLLAVGSQEPQFFKELLKGLGLEEAQVGEQWDRGRWPETKRLFAARFATKTRDEWRDVFDHVDACVTPVLGWEEVEGPLQPLVELERTPAVTIQEEGDEMTVLEKGEGGDDVLREWLGGAEAGGVEIHARTKLVTKRAAKL